MGSIHWRVCAAMVAGLSGCASNSGVVSMGAGTLLLTAQASTGLGGLGNLKADALQQAGAHCQKQGKDFTVLSVHETKPPYVFGNYPRVDLNFRCAEVGMTQ